MAVKFPWLCKNDFSVEKNNIATNIYSIYSMFLVFLLGAPVFYYNYDS